MSYRYLIGCPTLPHYNHGLHINIVRIQQANSFSQVDVRDTIERLNLDTFMGQLFFGSDHSNQLSCLFVQLVNGTRKVIGPPLAQLESFDVIHPFPTWRERVFARTFNGML